MTKPILHPGSCVAIDGQGLLIEGHSASGKSSLALALIDRGAILVSDDVVSLKGDREALIASPAPNIRGKIEIRNVGLVELPCADAPVSLIVRLDTKAPRHIEQANIREIAGRGVPEISLFPDTLFIALRAEWALKIYGRATAQTIEPNAQ